jgi:hypothetical protein
MKRIALLLLGISLLTALSLTKTFAQDRPSMPDYVLHAAQTLNAQYGANIDLNNVIWNFFDYNQDLQRAKTDCPQSAQSAPTLNNTHAYIVEFQPVRNGLWGQEIWEVLVYGDLSFVGICSSPLPAAVTIVPGSSIPTVTPSSCGNMPSHLVIGQEARVAGTSPNNLRSEPFVSGQYLGEIPASAIFLVLDGPRCSNDGAWWYVNYAGTAGWTLEGQSGTYYLEPLNPVTAQATIAPTVAPLSPAATPIVCNPAMPSRLIIGQQARVTPGIPNNVRAQAGSSGQLLGEIPAGSIFRVLAGPSCASGVAWWQVDYNGLIGWTGEGSDGDYWLEPQFAAIPPITTQNVDSLQQIVVSELASAASLQFSNGNTLFAHNAARINRYRAAAPFAAADGLLWSEETVLSAQAAYLAVLSLGNELEWFATLDATSVRVSQRAADGTYQERHLIGNLNITKAVFSPDARYLMLVDNTQAIQVFDMQAGQITAIIPATSAEPIQDLAFSPDGRYFAAYADHSLILWAAGSWTALDSNFSDTIAIKGMALNNYQLAYVLLNGNQEYVVVENIVSLQSASLITTIAANFPIQDLVLANDGSFILLATEQGLEYSEIPDETATLTAGVIPLNFDEANGTVTEMNLSPDGRLLAIATNNGMFIWAAFESPEN